MSADRKGSPDAHGQGDDLNASSTSAFESDSGIQPTHPFIEYIRSKSGHAQAILAAIPDLLFIVSHEGVFLSGHARDESELLAPQDTFTGKSAREVLPPEVADGFDRAIKQIVAGEQLVSFSYALEMPGGLRDYHARITPVDSSSVVVVARDVTEREQALRDSVRSAALLEQAGEMAAIGAMSFDVENNELQFSTVAARIFSLNSNTKYTLHGFLDSLPEPDDRESIQTRFEHLVHNGGEIDEVCHITRADQSKVWIRCSIRAEWREGKVHRLFGPVHDITLQKEASAKIDQMLKAVQHHNQRLTSFAQIVSHNLKSHAANLSALSEMLNEEGYNGDLSRTFTYLDQATQNLNQTVLHLAEVARINMFDAASLKPLNLRDSITKAFETVRALAMQAEVELLNEVDAHISVPAFDEYLDSIVLNLISNAIRYRSNERKPYVRASAKITYDEVELRIEDNGLGINLDRFGDQVFQMYKTFHQHPESRGIGLFITKSQIESMGGSIAVQSSPNVGSTFTVKWPRN